MEISTEIKTKFLELHYLRSIYNLLEWDEKTYLPTNAAEGRAQQLSFMAGQIYNRETNSEFISELSELADKTTDDVLKRTCFVALRDFSKRAKIPKSLVEEITNVSATTHIKWKHAKAKADFSYIAPDLKKLLKLKINYAACLTNKTTNQAAYDILLDDYEPGFNLDKYQIIFNPLKENLLKLFAKLNLNKNKNVQTALQMPRQMQRELFEQVVQLIGFDLSRGRVDETLHPFCERVGIADVRLTTEYKESHLFAGLFATLHEAGHGLYEQGLATHLLGAAPCQSCSLGVHESQSLFWEKQIGRSLGFTKSLFNLINNISPSVVGSFEDLYRIANLVQPSMIRIYADEVTYGLHVIIRFELEQKLFNGDLQIDELPEAWNDLYQNYLGIRPANDSEGVLQDIHWYCGAFGYFPTYLLGAVFAAQIANYLKINQARVWSATESANYQPVLSWLQQSIYQHGRLYLGEELIKQATESEVSAEAYITYLTDKYSQLY